jgi:hypothetical protein
VKCRTTFFLFRSFAEARRASAAARSSCRSLSRKRMLCTWDRSRLRMPWAEERFSRKVSVGEPSFVCPTLRSTPRMVPRTVSGAETSTALPRTCARMAATPGAPVRSTAKDFSVLVMGSREA